MHGGRGGITEAWFTLIAHNLMNVSLTHKLITCAGQYLICPRKVDIRLPGKGNSNFHGARPVYKNHLDD